MRMFVGLDVHKKYTEVAIVDEDGVVTEQERIENEPGQIEEFSNRLKQRRHGDGVIFYLVLAV